MSSEMQVTMTRDEKGKPKGMEFKTFRLKTTTDGQGIEERFLEFHTDKLRSFLRDNISIEVDLIAPIVLGVREATSLEPRWDNCNHATTRTKSSTGTAHGKCLSTTFQPVSCVAIQTLPDFATRSSPA